MTPTAYGIGVTLLGAAAVFAQGAPDLLAPTRVRSGTEFIDVTTGHAAPLMRDMDGDGIPDLLVGEFGSGRFPEAEFLTPESKKYASTMCHSKVRIYKNRGTKTEPRFDGFEYLKTREGAASIPMT